MTDFGSLIITGSLFFSVLICLILFFRKSDRLFANRLLSITLFGFFWYAFVLIINATRSVNSIRYIYGYGTPIYYTTPVTAYLYVRVTIFQQDRLKRSDWVHFIPAIVSFILCSSFYFADSATKNHLIDLLIKNPNNTFYCNLGMIPNSWNICIRPVQGLVYSVFGWKLIAPLLAGKRRFIKSPALRTWIICFTVFVSLSYVNLAIATVQGVYNLSRHMQLFTIIRVPYAIGAILFLALSIYPIVFPEVLYGIISPRYRENKGGESSFQDTQEAEEQAEVPDANRADKQKQTMPQPEQVLGYALLIEEYIQGTQFFMKPGVTINELAAGVDISPRYVSYVINNHFGQRFTDYINAYRIDYVKTRIALGDLKLLTLESLANDAGFSSRSNFYAAFKKITGISPSEYIQSSARINESLQPITEY